MRPLSVLVSLFVVAVLVAPAATFAQYAPGNYGPYTNYVNQILGLQSQLVKQLGSGQATSTENMKALADISQKLLQLQGAVTGGSGTTGSTASGYSPVRGIVSAGGTCPMISQTLSLGSSGYEVTELQNYLIGLGLLPVSAATGYYGEATQAAVQKMQSQAGIVTSGTPSTTGYGNVGPATQQYLARCSVGEYAAGGGGSEATGVVDNRTCSSDTNDLLLDTSDSPRCQPSVAEFVAKTGVPATLAAELIYGVIGANTDYRNWAAIMASSDPVAAARQAAGQLYNSDLPYEAGRQYSEIPREILAQSGNLAWVQMGDGKQYLFLVTSDGELLRNIPVEPGSLLTTAINFGVADPEAFADFGKQLTNIGVNLTPGQFQGSGSTAGIDFANLAAGGLGTTVNWVNDGNCAAKGPGACEANATNQQVFNQYQETLIDAGVLQSSCETITDATERSVYQELYDRPNFDAATGWVGSPSSCSWLTQ